MEAEGMGRYVPADGIRENRRPCEGERYPSMFHVKHLWNLQT